MGKLKKRAFDHVIVIMFENQYRSYVMENPYMRELATKGINMENYFGVMHPSQTNYISSISGELCNVTDDKQPSPLPQRTIVDLIEESPEGLNWKAYMDSYIKQNTPWTPDLLPKDEYPYVIKHNPFSSFENIIRDQARWEKIEDESALWKDLINGTLPEYSWFTPNMWNDGHYLNGTQTDPKERAPALVDQLAIWLEGFFGDLRFPGPNSHLPPNTLVVVTFDESDFEADYDKGKKYTYDGPNQIYTVLLGDMIEPGIEKEGYNHYSLLRTIEENYGLASLEKNDKHSNWFRFLWNEQFSWTPSQKTPVTEAGGIALAEYRGLLYFVYLKNSKELYFRTWDGKDWSEERAIGFSAIGSPALVTSGNQLLLLYRAEGQNLVQQAYDLEKDWSTPQNIAEDAASDPAIVSYGNNTMVAWKNESGNIISRACENARWGNAIDTGHISDGHVTLCTLGSNIFLIFKTVGKETMSVVTYNTEPFNIVTCADSTYSGPYDDTTMGQWSPSAFPVAHFSHGPNPLTPKEDEPVLQPYLSGASFVATSLDGVIHLVNSSPDNSQLMTETFSIGGVMTPKLPVSYNSSDQTTTSNGYGTLAEAGWTTQSTINASFNNGNLAISQFGSSIVLAYQSETAGAVHICSGQYVREKETNPQKQLAKA